MDSLSHNSGKGVFLLRLILCIIVILAGLFVMRFLSNLRQPPSERTATERPLHVDGMVVTAESVDTSILGYGEVHPLEEVQISSEVAGQVIHIHQKLYQGEIIPAGEVLFRIDPRNYQAIVRELDANLKQFESSIKRLQQQQGVDEQRLTSLERIRDLAEKEFRRLADLFNNDQVGTLSGVEAAESRYKQSVDQVNQLKRTLTTYPTQIQEIVHQSEAVKARKAKALADVERCSVHVDYPARVKETNLEVNQYVNPGQSLITLANDSILEILVPIDSQDASRWLYFDNEQMPLSSSSVTNKVTETAWFDMVRPVTCEIRWTENPHDYRWFGKLDRVVEFRPDTRTLFLAIRLPGSEARPDSANHFPLVEGMFCEVSIPGRRLENVYRLPRQIVSFENTVYCSVDNRLKTVPVTVARIEGEQALITSGLQNGDLVVLTRLVDPLENSLLDMNLIQPDSPDSAQQ